MLVLKFLNADGSPRNGGSGTHDPPKRGRAGKWMPHSEYIVLCRHGYHACRLAPAVDAIEWIGPALFIAKNMLGVS